MDKYHEEDPKNSLGKLNNYCSTCQTDHGPTDSRTCIQCRSLICQSCCISAHWCNYCCGYICDICDNDSCDNDSAHQHLPTTESAPPPSAAAAGPDPTDLGFPDTITEEIIEPHWPSMFKMAARIVLRQIKKENGQDFILEMLDYGCRLAENQNPTKSTQGPSKGSQ